MKIRAHFGRVYEITCALSTETRMIYGSTVWQSVLEYNESWECSQTLGIWSLGIFKVSDIAKKQILMFNFNISFPIPGVVIFSILAQNIV